MPRFDDRDNEATVSNRFWFQLHGWFSLPVWLVFTFVCITGTIAVVSHELTWLTNPEARATNPQGVPPKPIADLVDVVVGAYPSADVTNVLVFEPYLVTAVVFTDHDKPHAIAYVNQYTGEIQELNLGLSFIDFMRSLHGWLLFPWHTNYSIGYYIVSAMAIVMLGALITGLVIYKNFWRSFTQPKLRFHQGKKTILADLHRLAGVWSIWFLIVMSVTGLWYLIQAMLWHAEVDIEPHAPLIAASQLPMQKQSPEVSLADAMQLAYQHFPQFQPSYVALPEHTRDMYHLSGSGGELLFDDYSYGLSINPWTGEISHTQSPETMTPLQTLSHIADPLHFGTFGGLWTKLIWFVFGLLISGMSITGFMMWGSRVVKSVRKPDTVEAIYAD
ncbi:PepSY-associated TM helix domain-containing protein [Shewanella khirikhana]|uniref:PepSY-associated TM helix domain-containing protein n=1 Tax=Shewanella khirikhana TaxID=1965282 RepID=UPI0030CDE4F5